MSRIADFYVVLEARGDGKAAAVSTRKNRPYTEGHQIAVRLKLTLPDDAFTRWVPTVEATVDDKLIVPPYFEVVEPEPLPENEPEPEPVA